MPTLNSALVMAIGVGGVTARVNLAAALAGIAEIVHDCTVAIEENGSAETIWQASTHGAAQNPQPEAFRVGLLALVEDPDEAAAAPYLELNAELAATRHNSTMVDRQVRRLARGSPMLLASSAVSRSVSEAGDVTDILADLAAVPVDAPRITRIRVRNPHPVGTPAGSNTRRVRLILFR